MIKTLIKKEKNENGGETLFYNDGMIEKDKSGNMTHEIKIQKEKKEILPNSGIFLELETVIEKWWKYDQDNRLIYYNRNNEYNEYRQYLNDNDTQYITKKENIREQTLEIINEKNQCIQREKDGKQHFYSYNSNGRIVEYSTYNSTRLGARELVNMIKLDNNGNITYAFYTRIVEPTKYINAYTVEEKVYEWYKYDEKNRNIEYKTKIESSNLESERIYLEEYSYYDDSNKIRTAKRYIIFINSNFCENKQLIEIVDYDLYQNIISKKSNNRITTVFEYYADDKNKLKFRTVTIDDKYNKETNTKLLKYDEYDRLIYKETTESIESFEYEKDKFALRHKKIMSLNGTGHLDEYYDEEGRIIKEINKAYIIEYEYKDIDNPNCITLKKYNNIKERFKYSNKICVYHTIQKGRKIVYKETWAYDNNNRLLKYENSNGDFKVYRYDHKNRKVYESENIPHKYRITIYNDGNKPEEYYEKDEYGLVKHYIGYKEDFSKSIYQMNEIFNQLEESYLKKSLK